ncbi:MAG: methylcrotonoyl-CoA carboxylase, partial [Deltaproteobacteria bacterium]|nr:methylcrotonoyl-CoA carboxylase [Deltaproteobacteria bacterium]
MSEIIETQINSQSDEFKENASHLKGLVQIFRDEANRVKQGGGPAAVEKHRKRGKLPPRERIEKILDPGSPFLEFSTLAAKDMYQNEAPGAGIV